MEKCRLFTFLLQINLFLNVPVYILDGDFIMLPMLLGL